VYFSEYITSGFNQFFAVSNRPEKSIRIIFFSGFNMNGKPKVEMKELTKILEDTGFRNVTTVLNTGNIILQPNESLTDFSDSQLSSLLETHFGFPMPLISISSGEFLEQMNGEPFKNVRITDQTRLYVSLVATNIKPRIIIPWISADGTLTITRYDKMIFSHLNLEATQMPKGIEELERIFGKRIITRNFTTMLKIRDKLVALNLIKLLQ